MYNMMIEKGLTTPTANGSAAELLNPISLEVNKDVMGALASSCPEK